jgi:hypothetical protein
MGNQNGGRVGKIGDENVNEEMVWNQKMLGTLAERI